MSSTKGDDLAIFSKNAESDDDRPCVFVQESANSWRIIYADEYEAYRRSIKSNANVGTE